MLPLKARTYTGPRYGAEMWRYGLVQETAPPKKKEYNK